MSEKLSSISIDGKSYEEIKDEASENLTTSTAERNARSETEQAVGKHILAMQGKGLTSISEEAQEDYDDFSEACDFINSDHSGASEKDKSKETEDGTSEKSEFIETEKTPAERLKELYLEEIRRTIHVQKILKHGAMGARIYAEIGENNIRRANKGKTINGGNRETRYLRDLESKFSDTAERGAERNPRTFIAANGLKLQEMIRSRNMGDIMRTPYVSRKMDDVRESIDRGEPVFIHGHLGSGKTELAITAAKDAMIDKYAQQRAKLEFKKFKQENPELSFVRLMTKRGEIFEDCRTEVRSLVTGTRKPKEGDEEVIENCRPLVISGSRDLKESDLFVDKGLILATPFDGQTVAEAASDFEKEFADYVKEGHDGSDEDQLRAEFLEIFQTKHAAFGTEIEKIENAVFQGMKEGRPVIIDEANSIPAGVLISLNNILNKRPGGVCYVPGVGNVEIQEGFSIIMTGNLNSGNANYVGVESELNPATKSRMKMIEYDYLPQKEEGGIEYRENPAEDELFQVMLAYVANSNGSMEINGGDKALDQLYSLAEVARTTQKLFAGKVSDSKAFEGNLGSTEMPKFHSDPISVRAIKKILEEWNRGDMTVSEAFFRGYVGTIVDPDDQHTVFKAAVSQGLFSAKEGWTLDGKIEDQSGHAIAIGDINEIFDGRKTPQERKTYNIVDTIKLMYGEGPDDDGALAAALEAEFAENDEEEMTDEEYMEKIDALEGRIGAIGKAIEVLKIFSEQCGCDVNKPTE